MLENTYRGQCAAVTLHCTNEGERWNRGLRLGARLWDAWKRPRTESPRKLFGFV